MQRRIGKVRLPAVEGSRRCIRVARRSMRCERSRGGSLTREACGGCACALLAFAERVAEAPCARSLSVHSRIPVCGPFHPKEDSRCTCEEYRGRGTSSRSRDSGSSCLPSLRGGARAPPPAFSWASTHRLGPHDSQVRGTAHTCAYMHDQTFSFQAPPTPSCARASTAFDRRPPLYRRRPPRLILSC